MPAEEQDSELNIWLQAYYPHLKGKIGKVTEVLPYKKQQYWVEFDVKHEDNRIIMSSFIGFITIERKLK